MHVNPVTAGAVYVPHAFPYAAGTIYGPQAVYSAPMPYDPAYFVHQGGLVYLHPPYEPLEPEIFSGHSPYSVGESTYDTSTQHRSRTNASNVLGRDTTDSRPKVTLKPATIAPRRLVYPAPSISIDKQDNTFGVPSISLKEPYGLSNYSPFSAFRLSEPRTERAFSAGFVSDTITMTSEGSSRPKLTTPSHLDSRKKRAGSQPIVAPKRRGSQPPPSIIGTRRTDLNWRNVPVRRSPGNDSGRCDVSGVHKYFQ